MEYVILGAGAAGITAAKTIRKADKNGKITVISTDTQVHSRCMLHKYLSHERDAAGISFVGKQPDGQKPCHHVQAPERHTERQQPARLHHGSVHD